MSQLDDLLNRSREPGQFVERRTFTLSREKAIEKQRAFALRDPHQYILEFIQSAVFQGCSYIAIDTTPDSLLVAWVGAPPLTQGPLGNLLDYLFVDRTDVSTRHLVQLAVGVNAILKAKPEVVRIESGDGYTTTRMDLDATGAGEVGTVAEPIGGTYLHIKFKGGFFRNWRTQRHIKEQQQVEERCLYTPVPILLNGSAPFGYRGSRHIEIFGAYRQRHFDKDGRRGVVAIHTNPRAPTGFRIIIGGVWVATLQLDELADRPLVGVVCDPNLRKTADHADIVLDYRYVELLHALQPEATRLIRKLNEGPYFPPKLPPIPSAPAPEVHSEVSDAEPLPESIQLHGVRGTTTLEQLREISGPLFYATPDRLTVLHASIDPVPFPWPVLVLTDGQATTLRSVLDGDRLHRLSSPADADFVRRMAEQGSSSTQRSTEIAGARVTLRIHPPRDMPAWTVSPHGVPFAIVANGVTVQLGTIDGRTVHVVTESVAPRRVEVGLSLPHVSLVLEFSRALTEDGSSGTKPWLDTAHVEAVLQLAAEAVSAGEAPVSMSLATLMHVARGTSWTNHGRWIDLPSELTDDVLDRPLLATLPEPSSIRDLLIRMRDESDPPELSSDAGPETHNTVQELGSPHSDFWLGMAHGTQPEDRSGIPGQDARPRWLSRVEVRGPVGGWLGLTETYCPHVTMRTPGRLIEIDAYFGDTPCAGRITAQTHGEETQRALRLLRLDIIPLYRDLAERLPSLADHERRGGHEWAFDFVSRAWRRTGELEGLARRLAERIPLDDGDGSPWGTLAEWMASPSDHRPPLPYGWEAPSNAATELVPHTQHWLALVLEQVFHELRLLCFLREGRGRTPVRLDSDGAELQSARLLLDKTHPLVKQAEGGSETARHILQIEATRLLVLEGYAFEPGSGTRGYLDAQQRLLTTWGRHTGS